MLVFFCRRDFIRNDECRDEQQADREKRDKNEMTENDTEGISVIKCKRDQDKYVCNRRIKTVFQRIFAAFVYNQIDD